MGQITAHGEFDAGDMEDAMRTDAAEVASRWADAKMRLQAALALVGDIEDLDDGDMDYAVTVAERALINALEGHEQITSSPQFLNLNT